MLNGGLSNVTRQYSGVRRWSRTACFGLELACTAGAAPCFAAGAATALLATTTAATATTQTLSRSSGRDNFERIMIFLANLRPFCTNRGIIKGDNATAIDCTNVSIDTNTIVQSTRRRFAGEFPMLGGVAGSTIAGIAKRC
jgi:hypothetical protein